jgi:hypothetical protein
VCRADVPPALTEAVSIDSATFCSGLCRLEYEEAVVLASEPEYDSELESGNGDDGSETVEASAEVRVVRHRNSYTYQFQRTVLDSLSTQSARKAAAAFGVPRRTIRDWIASADAIRAYLCSERRRTQRHGRRESIPFGNDLVTYMKDVRREEWVRSLIYNSIY